MTNAQPTGGSLVHSQEAGGFNRCPGANPALHSSHVAVSLHHSPHEENAGSTIDISLTLLFLPPSPFQLLLRSAAPCFSFINTAFDVGPILLCQPSNTATCVIVLDLSRCQGCLARSDRFQGTCHTFDIFN